MEVRPKGSLSWGTAHGSPGGTPALLPPRPHALPGGTHTAPPLLREAELFCRRKTRAPRSTAGCVCSSVAFRGWNRDTGPICRRGARRRVSEAGDAPWTPGTEVLGHLSGTPRAGWGSLGLPFAHQKPIPNLACK